MRIWRFRRGSETVAGTPRNGRLRVLVWAAVICAIIGAIGGADPLENSLRSARNIARRHDPSGTIVVVAIDDKSLKEINAWPWPRRYHAEITDRLAELGAKRIHFDVDFSSYSNPVDDRLLEQAFARHPGKVTLPAHFAVAALDGKRVPSLPAPHLRQHVSLANINIDYDYSGSAWNLPYAMPIEGVTYPSLSSLMGGVRRPGTGNFPIDYSIDLRRVPVVSYTDVLHGRVPASFFKGKEVVIGLASTQLGDIFLLPSFGLMPGLYLHVLGAETLKEGTPVHFGWLSPYLLALGITGLALFIRRRAASHLPLLIAGFAYFALPFALEAKLIFVDILPGLFLLLGVWGVLAWRDFRQSYRLRGTTNAISGLPNLAALREEKSETARLLVAARIHNFAEVASALPGEEEKALTIQIANRLTLRDPGIKVYQGDEGIFAWVAEPDLSSSIGDHLDALQALFRSPVTVGGNPVDLTITFGIEYGSDREIANRLGSALVAADEAKEQGLAWKAFDPAKLKDAAWKLSLLSQLDAAIDAEELWLAFQPKLDCATNLICGAEALVRWTHKEKGPIPPMEFVPAAEQSGRIEKLTAYVLKRAIAYAAMANDRGIIFNVAVNLSARLIDDVTLPGLIQSLLDKHGLPASRLTLEVTETAAITSSGGNLETLRRLRDMGIQLSIDDYGTGLSTLDYLKRIPASEIKIDKSFVQGAARSHGDKLLVHSTIQLAHSLGRRVVAEGVEDQETLTALRKMGCDAVQGYLIGRPVRFGSVMRQIIQQQRRRAA
ncbi:MAG: EAL domain-containing protein [Alphaproteobacteria bacterium]|nr:MAG: EAL domain-containing protein [Alphaproteobacteria bacterium]